MDMHFSLLICVGLILLCAGNAADGHLVHIANMNKCFQGKLIIMKPNVSFGNCSLECQLRSQCKAANYWRTQKSCELLETNDTTPLNLLTNGQACVSIARMDLLEIAGCSGCDNRTVCMPTTGYCFTKECEEFTVEKGYVAGSMLHVGSQRKVICNEFYRLEPSFARPSCQADGYWDISSLSCVPDIICSGAPVVNNAILLFVDGDGTPGTILTYSCDDGYYSPFNMNNYSIVCQHNEQWTDVGFQCKINCSEPEVIEYAALDSGETLEGHVRIFTCWNNYITSTGSSTIPVICTNTGEWTTPTDTCLRSCGDPSDIYRASVLPGTVHEGSTRTYQCVSGYYMKKEGVVTTDTTGDVTCNSVGTWEGVLECVAECVNSAAMVSGANGISDARITATSYYSSDYRSYYGRLNNDKSWSPDDSSTAEYIQVDLVTKKVVNKITTQGSAYVDDQEWVKSYKLSYSTNCVNFLEYNQKRLVVSGVRTMPPYIRSRFAEKVFSGNTDRNSHVSHVINPAISARCVRVVPVTWNEWIVMRIELFGC